jgi:hypothetical protein
VFIDFRVVRATSGCVRTPAYFRMLRTRLRKTDWAISQELMEVAAKEVRLISKESRVCP